RNDPAPAACARGPVGGGGLRVLRRRSSGALLAEPLQEPGPPLRPPALPPRGVDLLGGLRGGPARSIRGGRRLRSRLSPAVGRRRGAGLPPARLRPPHPPGSRGAGHAPEAVDP